MLNNLEWYKDMGFLEFLRDVGKYARMGPMMAKESVKRRLASEEGISFTEFSYQLLQGYDFVHLHRHHGVNVQVGGSDQWGNITAGTDLLRKLPGGAELEAGGGGGGEGGGGGAFGVTFPLLLTADGKKFGKSEGGAVWLGADKLSPYRFYQYLFRTPDADVTKFLRMLTFLDLGEIEALEQTMERGEDYRPNTAQRLLAEEVTRFVHGEAGVELAQKATAALAPGSKADLDAETLAALAEELPTSALGAAEVVGAPVAEVLAKCGLQPSKGAARRLIKGGGVRLNNRRVESDEEVVGATDVLQSSAGELMLVAAGKKNKHIVRVARGAVAA